MPELPEVETVARQLQDCTAHRRIRALTINDSKLPGDGAAAVTGCRIDSVRRYGKRIVMALIPPRRRKPSMWLCVHLRMTGRLLYCANGETAIPVKRKPRAVIELDHGAIEFHDTRRFGTIEVTDDFSSVLPAGVEPLSDEFTCGRLAELINGSTTPLKIWLLRQDRIVGLGNIYASEICFRAGIHPTVPAGRLNKSQLRRLHRAIRSILTAAIKHCGTTFSDFQTASGSPGDYLRYLKVYGREGRPCRRCRGQVERIVQGQRSTFFCPACQPGGPKSGGTL